MSDDLPIRLPPVDPSAADMFGMDTLSPELLAGLLVDGDDELAAWALRHAMAGSTRVDVFDGLLRDAMTIIGERWQSGRWSVADEHLASRTLMHALERIRPDMGPEGRIGPVVVLAGVAGEQHVIGLACLEQVLAEAGWSVANLGADVPAVDLGRFVAGNDPVLVGISAMDAGRTPVVAEAVRAVRGAAGTRPVPVLIGGRIAGQPGLSEATGADGVATTMAVARAFAEAARRRSRPPGDA